MDLPIGRNRKFLSLAGGDLTPIEGHECLWLIWVSIRGLLSSRGFLKLYL